MPIQDKCISISSEAIVVICRSIVGQNLSGHLIAVETSTTPLPQVLVLANQKRQKVKWFIREFTKVWLDGSSYSSLKRKIANRLLPLGQITDTCLYL